jgi:phage tail protein X
VYKTALARGAFGGTVHALCRRRRTMACTITSLFLIAMFGIIAAGLAFRPGTKEEPSAQRQDTPVAPSGDRVMA